MEPNDNPPSEREWTIEEREEFFTSQDARTGSYPGLSGNPISMVPFRPSTSTHNCGDNLAKYHFRMDSVCAHVEVYDLGNGVCAKCGATRGEGGKWEKAVSQNEK